MGEPGPGEEMPPDEAPPGADARRTDTSGSEELSEDDRRIVESNFTSRHSDDTPDKPNGRMSR